MLISVNLSIMPIEDPNTGSIAVYIEGLDSPEAFKKSVQNSHKPVVVIKVGGSPIGKKLPLPTQHPRSS